MITLIFIFLVLFLVLFLVSSLFSKQKEGMVVFGKNHSDPDEDLTDFDNLFQD
jgi:hypothetical protein